MVGKLGLYGGENVPVLCVAKESYAAVIHNGSITEAVVSADYPGNFLILRNGVAIESVVVGAGVFDDKLNVAGE